MKHIYKAEIFLCPIDDTAEPYFWTLFEKNGDNWCNCNSGWSDSPQKSWIELYSFFSYYKRSEL